MCISSAMYNIVCSDLFMCNYTLYIVYMFCEAHLLHVHVVGDWEYHKCLFLPCYIYMYTKSYYMYIITSSAGDDWTGWADRTNRNFRSGDSHLPRVRTGGPAHPWLPCREDRSAWLSCHGFLELLSTTPTREGTHLCMLHCWLHMHITQRSCTCTM